MTKGAINGMSEDRERIERARAKLAGLFTEEDLADCRTALMQVVRDPESRQRVQAAALVFQVVQEADVDAKAASSGVKVVVIDRERVTQLSEQHREQLRATATMMGQKT